MRDGTCSKCGGREVYASMNGLSLAGGFPAAVQAHIEPGFRGMRARQVTNGIWQYLCAHCGHCEIYVLDDAVIDFVRGTWVRVPVAEAPDAG